MQFLHAFYAFHAGILFNSCPLGNICILNVRLGGETDQQNVIMHKAYFEIPLQLFFYDAISAVLYAANREFSSNACRKSIMRTIDPLGFPSSSWLGVKLHRIIAELQGLKVEQFPIYLL